MASARPKKPRGFANLDIEDMERRIVEFRVLLDREKRRCQGANMTDKFEALLKDKLDELQRNANQQQQQQQRANANQGPARIELQALDEASFRRLSQFLGRTVEMCCRFDQHEKYQGLLRETLTMARRRSLEAASLDPSTMNRALLEPFCLFCAGGLSSEGASCPAPSCLLQAEADQEPNPPQLQQPPPTTTTVPRPQHNQQQGAGGGPGRPELSLELHQFQSRFSQSFTADLQRPPQTANYTPSVSLSNLAAANAAAQSWAVSTTPPLSPLSPAPSGPRQQDQAGPMITIGPSGRGFQPSSQQQVNSTTGDPSSQTAAANVSATNASQPVQQQQRHKQQQQQQQARPGQTQFDFVGPSDASDAELEPEGRDVRDILSRLNERGLDRDGMRSSSPLSDGQLEIDESTATANRSQELFSPVKRPPETKVAAAGKLGVLLKTGRSPKRAPVVAPAAASNRPTGGNTEGSAGAQQQRQQQHQPTSGQGVQMTPSSHTRARDSALAGGRIEQVSEKLRDSVVKKKTTTKRRTRNL